MRISSILPASMGSSLFAATLLASVASYAQDAPRIYSTAEPVDPFAPKLSSVPANETPATVPMASGEVGLLAAETPANKPPANLSPPMLLKFTLTEPVVIQPRPFFYGSSLLAAGGLVGGLVSAAVSRDEPDRIAKFVREQEIHFDALVKVEFERQMNARAAFIEIYQAYAPAKFQLSAVYGITSVPFSDYRPYFSIDAELIDARGNVRWKNRDYIGARGKAVVMPYADFLVSKAVFLSEFDTAIAEVVGLILKDFRR